ncbi:MAG: hypothetical protein R3A10_14160 [Caldilineaceae bacterium]
MTEYAAAVGGTHGRPPPAAVQPPSPRPKAPLMAMAAAITVRRTSPVPAATDLTRR